MSTLEILVLAQGVQSRLPDLTIPKQWLPLPACAEQPILARTIVQTWRLTEALCHPNTSIKVACRADLARLVQKDMGVKVPSHSGIHRLHVGCHELDDPGNSSLKGARRALEQMRDHNNRVVYADRTVILLGDVVYSWHCLEVLFGMHAPGAPGAVIVAATSDLSPSGGELWGISWPSYEDAWVRAALDVALEKHPPFSEYQPGQLRRWHWAMSGMLHNAVRPVYASARVDDYTDDVDLPEDVKNLPLVAAAAAADDQKRGITWPI